MTPNVLLFLNMGLTTPSYGELELRLAAATLGGNSKSAAVFRGRPQRGVLSPVLWCFVIDKLIVRINGGGIYTQGYVDVICLLLVGKFFSMVLGLIPYCTVMT
jgi:hypothetical protein